MDRNLLILLGLVSMIWSLSARRAWIEMSYLSMETLCQVSLSARRAWIEIHTFPLNDVTHGGVALRKESVDRNDLPG